MTMNEIRELMDCFDASGLAYLEVETEGGRVKMKKAEACGVNFPQAVPLASAPAFSTAPEAPASGTAAVEAGILVKAPLVGVFYAAPAPGETPFVRAGQTVSKGQTLCLVEAMKMLNEIPSPADGVIEEVLVQDGELVEFDAPLFRLEEC